ncbi:hypothetical protein [Anaerorhabdus furcosa]|uniref:Antibiotic biosynthesis monooxygenase n=1 Tax=Anaerorhabdus furcosa TaxID=118967 RepID=A0A1T4NHP1_9FIRM|nr:hypothetical protein [Anaerorhabdus furcosa]SJZ78633.1 hypothetical protein SAMN02745191_1635 [Anaerorhabdus furcosa]
MKKTAWIITYKLKKGVDEEDFIDATQCLHDEVLSKAKGFIFWQQYKQESTWTDFVMWESTDDANNGLDVGHGTIQAKHFYSFIQMTTCRMTISEFVKQYERSL